MGKLCVFAYLYTSKVGVFCVNKPVYTLDIVFRVFLCPVIVLYTCNSPSGEWFTQQTTGCCSDAVQWLAGLWCPLPSFFSGEVCPASEEGVQEQYCSYACALQVCRHNVIGMVAVVK